MTVPLKPEQIERMRKESTLHERLAEVERDLLRDIRLAPKPEGLSRDQEVRIAALREANYYFGFVAGVQRVASLGPTDPTVRAGLVIGMASVFEEYIRTGEVPDARSS